MKYSFLKIMALLRALIIVTTNKIKCDGLCLFWPGVFFHKSKKSTVLLGNKVVLYHNVGIHMDSDNAFLSIGEGTYINKRSEIRIKDKVTIGADCAISWDVSILDTDYHSINGNEISKPISIGNHVWILTDNDL